eukprot:g32117.t1
MFNENTADETLTFPLAPTGTYDFQVDWEDGSSSYCNTSICSHRYSQPSLYNVSVSRLLKGLSFINTYSTMENKLVDVPHWGGVCLGDGGQQFREVTLTYWTASDLPCTSQVSNMQSMFRYASNFNQDLSSWDTSSVSNMQSTFRYASNFNQDVSSWDTSSVTDMQFMFYFSYNFNQPLNTWDTSSATCWEGARKTKAGLSRGCLLVGRLEPLAM